MPLTQLDLDAAARRRWPVVVVGGGPAAARQVAALSRRGEDVLLVADRLGGWMENLGPRLLQSYLPELALADDERIEAAFGPVDLQPSGSDYSAYVRDFLLRRPVRALLGTVTDITADTTASTVADTDGPRDGLRCELVTADGRRGVIRAGRVVLATGTVPRRPPAGWARAGAVTFDTVYRELHAGDLDRYRGRSVLIVGSGNSAMQTAALVCRVASDVTILANRYLGMYPQESSDRFAWRSLSQLTYELITKSGERCRWPRVWPGRTARPPGRACGS